MAEGGEQFGELGVSRLSDEGGGADDITAVVALPGPGLEIPLPGRFVDISPDAFWEASGAKPGNGIGLLFDDDTETFWQSDGQAPHMLCAHFTKRQSIAGIALYLDIDVDESYTPTELSIRAGSVPPDCRQIKRVPLEEPKGWIWIPLVEPLDGPEHDDDLLLAPTGAAKPQGEAHEEEEEEAAEAGGGAGQGSGPARTFRCLRCHRFELWVRKMHQNGRDTHIRQLKVLSPLAESEAQGIQLPSATDPMRLASTVR